MENQSLCLPPKEKYLKQKQLQLPTTFPVFLYWLFCLKISVEQRKTIKMNRKEKLAEQVSEKLMKQVPPELQKQACNMVKAMVVHDAYNNPE